MRQPEPVLTLDLFPEERSRFVELLASLSDDEWERPTVCEGWSVKDVALHVLGGDIANISRRRDGHSVSPAELESWDDLVAFLNGWNEQWVEVARRTSSRLLLDLLRLTGEQLHQYFATLDMFALGAPVSWAGPEPAPVWLDVAREYTERWLHQQHVRDAVGRPGLTDGRFFAPVLATFVRARPHTFRDVDAPNGTSVRLTVSGNAGGEWSVVRQGDRWLLAIEAAGAPAASVSFDYDTAWRLFTKGLAKDEAQERAHLTGDPALTSIVFDTVSIIA